MPEKWNVTEAEMKILLRLWDHHPQTMMELTRALEAETHWSKYTVITLLKRMEAKGTVIMDDTGSVKTYSPAVEKNVFAREETDALVRDLYGGSAALLVQGLVEQGKISTKEMDELFAMLRSAAEQ